ncbi:unnamed protein product [Closterium sp. NIES-54]
MFPHIKDLVDLDDSGPKAWKLLRDVVQPDTLPMVIVLEKELAALSMPLGDDVTPQAEMLDEVKPPRKIKFVAAASGALLPVIGAGNANVMGANGELLGLGNVLLVEGLSANIHSARRLQKSKAKVTFGPTSCRAKLGKLLLWNLEEKSSYTKNLWQLPIIPWSGKPPATAAAAAMAKAIGGGEETAVTDGALDAVKKVQKTQQSHGEVLAGVDGTIAWAKASSRSGEADWETWHERLCHISIPMLQKLVKEWSLKGLQVKGAEKEIGSCPTCLETKFTKFPFSSITGPAKVALVKNRVMATVGEKRWVPYTKWYGSAPVVNMLRAYGCMVVFHVPKEKRGKLEASRRWGVHLGIAKDHKGWLLWDLTSQKMTVSRDVKFLQSVFYKELNQQQHKLPTTPLIIKADEDGGEPEVEEQQQQQQGAPPHAPHPPERPTRDVCPPARLTYPSRGQPKVVRAGSVAEQCDEDEIAHCYWAAVSEPKTLAEALSGPDAKKWKQSVKEVYDSLWRMTCGSCGFQQTKGKDFDEIFAPVGKGTTVTVLLATVANCGWRIKKMDITTAFLNGIILEVLYMQQPEGLDDGSGRVCKLKKAIYGLKQAPRAWYHKLEETLLAGGFKKSKLASVVSCPSHEQMEAAKRLARYVRATASVGLEYSAVRQTLQRGAADLGNGDMLLTCYTNASFNSVKEDRTSIGGYVCLFGGGAVSWCSKKLNKVGQSSCETEYMALHHGAKEVMWLRHLLEEIGFEQKDPKVVLGDNKSAVKLAKNACLHGLTKHIRPKLHWVRRLLEKEVRLEIVKSYQQAADILTKRLAEPEHWKGMKLAGMSVH